MVSNSSGDCIVIPDDQSANALGCVRSLGSKGIRTVVASEFENTPTAASRYCDELVLVPSPHTRIAEYKDALLSLTELPDVQTIIPTREEDAYILSKYHDDFAEHLGVGWPSYESLRTVHDGYRLAEAAEEAGVPVPKTQLLTEVDDWDRELIVKSRYSILTGDYVDFFSEGECDRVGQDPIYLPTNVEPDVDDIVDRMRGSVPIVQECVSGTEYSVRALFEDGELVTKSLRRQLRGKTYAGGASVFREMTRDPRVEALAESLLEHLEWHGLASVQFVHDEETGQFKLLEINPRVWASVMLDTRAGADYPHDYWLLTNGESDRIVPGYDDGVATHLLIGEAKYLLSVLRDDFPNVERPTLREAVWNVASSVYEHPHFDYLSLDDPAPFVRGVANLLPVGDSGGFLTRFTGDDSLQSADRYADKPANETACTIPKETYDGSESA